MPTTILTTTNSPMLRFALDGGSILPTEVAPANGTYYLNYMQAGGVRLEQVKTRGTISTVKIIIDRDDVATFGPIVFLDFSALYCPVKLSYTAFSEEELSSSWAEVISEQIATYQDQLYEQFD